MIEIKNVSKAYVKDKKVVENINLKIEDGIIFGFIGPNGAGKTTTMEMLTGVLDIDEGEILIDGINIEKEPIKAKQEFGFVPDIFRNSTALLIFLLVVLLAINALINRYVRKNQARLYKKVY